ncbi:hypothetical protein KC19_VG285400 [Ceratodon purpureus]|uniref:Uncharacterized protein n=1 Tax=Ceratodon purpureus TaxID=3225 RepID=A0A8T0HVI9_CERPU|nr:hypothetical protein KC19_VG285400 [Ceratodon purpureus]
MECGASSSPSLAPSKNFKANPGYASVPPSPFPTPFPTPFPPRSPIPASRLPPLSPSPRLSAPNSRAARRRPALRARRDSTSCISQVKWLPLQRRRGHRAWACTPEEGTQSGGHPSKIQGPGLEWH